MFPAVKRCPHCGCPSLFAFSKDGWRVRCSGSPVTAHCVLNATDRQWHDKPEEAAFEWNNTVSLIEERNQRRLYFP